ncbi:MAG: flagellar export protein FliJ [Longimicrobiales bacterium]
MRGFRFRLEKLRGLRWAEEQEKARRLAEAGTALDRAQGILERIAESEAGVQSRMRDALEEAPTAGVVQNLMVLLDAMRRQRTAAEEDRAAALDQVVEATTQLQEATRERKILDRLRDRHRGEWVREERQREQSILDEANRGRHQRLGDELGS